MREKMSAAEVLQADYPALVLRGHVFTIIDVEYNAHIFSSPTNAVAHCLAYWNSDRAPNDESNICDRENYLTSYPGWALAFWFLDPTHLTSSLLLDRAAVIRFQRVI